ncbi:hypothetical protein G3R49_05865 [Shewanella sp. WXL01]|uniref:SCP2 sterol-binding domain-containing protein n=1 Tax=Shewanella sp. WXL01 TaxID=2709721 RepID=UPI001438686C|nr:SCP2 sterol-binding domain-containing protein [Shewanella sp. WXL01]NKF50095.1 hypothetical protein [Shewanella sp. WXL01]
MRKRLISAALKIIPNRLQLKALEKAWHFVFANEKIEVGSHVRINLQDFNVSWLVPVTKTEQSQGEQHPLTVSFTLEKLLECRRKSVLQTAIDDGCIHVEGDAAKAQVFKKAVKSVSQPHLDRLVSRCCSFLHIKPEPRIDLATVSVSDIECDEDIDFIRDSAISVQKSDTQQALRLMLVAQQARPNGSHINRKVKEYQAQLR